MGPTGFVINSLPGLSHGYLLRHRGAVDGGHLGDRDPREDATRMTLVFYRKLLSKRV